MSDLPRSIDWAGDAETGVPRIIDLSLLPDRLQFRDLAGLDTACDAISSRAIDGAQALGIVAGYSLARHCITVAFAFEPAAPSTRLEAALDEAIDRLRVLRPAVANISWALERQRACFERHCGLLTAREMSVRLLLEARRIHREDTELCARIGSTGARLLPDRGGVLTLGVSGTLATGGLGSALGAIKTALSSGKHISPIIAETSPGRSGARVSAYELVLAGHAPTVIADAAAAGLMASGAIQAVILPALRVAADGSMAGESGSLALAILARHHNLPCYVAAPYSSFALDIDSIDDLVGEDGDGSGLAPKQVQVLDPRVDRTPASLMTALITERGVIEHPSRERVAAMMGERHSEPAV